MRNVLFLLFLVIITGCHSNPTDYSLKLGSAECRFDVKYVTDTVQIIVTEDARAIAKWEANATHVGDMSPVYHTDKFPYNPTRRDSIFQINPVTLEEFSLVAKDTIIQRKVLKLLNTDPKYIKVLRDVDTVMQINPVTLEEEIVITATDSLHVMADLGVTSFDEIYKQMLAGFVISGAEVLKLSNVYLYYENGTKHGRVQLQYPGENKEALQTLNCLANGGLIIIKTIGLNSRVEQEQDIDVDVDVLVRIKP